MKGKILFVAGLAVGYVLGTRAGREKYEELKAGAEKLWNDPRVQARVDDVEDFVKDKAPEVAQFATDTAKTVAAKVTGAGKKPAAKRPATRSTTTRKSSGSSASS